MKKKKTTKNKKTTKPKKAPKRATKRPAKKRKAPHVVQPLSPKQFDIAALITKGMSNKEIGKKLKITEGTVRQHLNIIYKKLGVHTRLELAAKYAV